MSNVLSVAEFGGFVIILATKWNGQKGGHHISFFFSWTDGYKHMVHCLKVRFMWFNPADGDGYIGFYPNSSVAFLLGFFRFFRKTTRSQLLFLIVRGH